MEKLAHEIATNEETRQQIDTLQLYFERRSHDGVEGLEAKLEHSGRADCKLDAFAKKELFAKLLTRYSLYASAQEIFAFMLARADTRFRTYVLPRVDELSISEIDALVISDIVEPIVEEIGFGPFNVNDAIVAGMVYWLAEQCFVRWHK